MCVGCVRVFVYTCAYVFSTCDDKPFAEWRTTRKSLRVLFCYFFCEKKVEFFFISKTVAPRARAFNASLSKNTHSAALSCTVRVTLFGGGRLVLLRICFCVCVRFLFGEGEGASFFFPSV